jgi:oligopeptide/dipeptide ABC transporter ATP-binding protein
LLKAVPEIDADNPKLPDMLPGEIPSLLNRPPGCHFHTRCPIARPECRRQEPALREISKEAKVACDWV